MQALCLANFTYYILQLQKIRRHFSDNKYRAVLQPQKFTAVPAGRQDLHCYF